MTSAFVSTVDVGAVTDAERVVRHTLLRTAVPDQDPEWPDHIVPVTGITSAAALASCRDSSRVRLADSTVSCWGLGMYGQLGNGAMTSSATPVAVSGITGVTGPGLGQFHACAAEVDGTVRCWGLKLEGQLGNDTTSNSATPVVVTGL